MVRGSTNIGGAAFVAAAQKPSQDEVLPMLSVIYLILEIQEPIFDDSLAFAALAIPDEQLCCPD
jgi:hypothetical protein